MGSLIGAGPPVTLTILLMTAPALAQAPLAEVAREEQERRASISEKSRVYTNDDLAGGPRLTTGTQPTQRHAADEVETAGAATTAGPAVAEPEPADPARSDEDTWRQRIMSARESKERAELLMEALQNRVDSLWRDFTARDDPFQRAQIEQDRLAALAELDHTRREVDRYNKEIADIREAARRAGVPPGWLR